MPETLFASGAWRHQKQLVAIWRAGGKTASPEKKTEQIFNYCIDL
tara:strand:- start:1356 stop:1490 length:135 start_codon:yes stop_codon:yes gene_type:complete